ncbi:hypothetical protein EIP86_006262 [Pleurotus ostreatoroseus]|nr:hypothetical protein EIP86_006262 [Pleurotus ostreatoroseus]
MESMESVSQALSNRDFSRDKAYGRANTPIMGVVVTRTVETDSDINMTAPKYSYEAYRAILERGTDAIAYVHET